MPRFLQVKLFIKAAHSFILCASLLSCATGPATPSSKIGNSLLHNYMSQHSHAFFQTSCAVYDANFKKVLGLPGDLCVYESNGNTVMANHTKLQKFDSRFKLLWSLNFKGNHQLKLSSDGETYLAIESQYYPRSNQVPIRFDNLRVISRSGKFLKSFRFEKKFLTESSGYETEPAPNEWTTDDFSGKSLEGSHVNSFSEIFKTVGDKQLLAGYVAYNTKPSMIIYFDTELKPKRVVRLGETKIHDLQQLDENTLLFYGNFFKESDAKSFAGTMGTNDSTPRTVYQNPSVNLMGRSCGSVQKLEGNKYFILHSNCGEWIGNKQKSHGHWEFVDMNTNQQEVGELPMEYIMANLKIVDMKSYFENNIGY